MKLSAEKGTEDWRGDPSNPFVTKEDEEKVALLLWSCMGRRPVKFSDILKLDWGRRYFLLCAFTRLYDEDLVTQVGNISAVDKEWVLTDAGRQVLSSRYNVGV